MWTEARVLLYLKYVNRKNEVEKLFFSLYVLRIFNEQSMFQSSCSKFIDNAKIKSCCNDRILLNINIEYSKRKSGTRDKTYCKRIRRSIYIYNELFSISIVIKIDFNERFIDLMIAHYAYAFLLFFDKQMSI